jgi:hypothetical protein
LRRFQHAESPQLNENKYFTDLARKKMEIPNGTIPNKGADAVEASALIFLIADG